MSRSRSLPYTKSGRLSDVMAMIQVLGLDPDAHRSERGLAAELQGPPKSARTWADVASDHLEFFRVTDKAAHSVSLIGRHVLPQDPMGARPPLDSDVLGKLLGVALDLHDRQVAQAQRWRVFLPVLGPVLAAIVAGSFALLGFLLGKAG